MASADCSQLGQTGSTSTRLSPALRIAIRASMMAFMPEGVMLTRSMGTGLA